MALGKEMLQNFSKKSLPRAMGRPSAKNYSFFKKKSLPRASPKALGKEILIFFKKVFAEGLQPWPSAKKCA